MGFVLAPRTGSTAMQLGQMMRATLLFMMMHSTSLRRGYISLGLTILSFVGTAAWAADSARPKPLQVLLVAGGCCHDYARQKDILKEGLEKRANVQVSVVYSPDKSTS